MPSDSHPAAPGAPLAAAISLATAAALSGLSLRTWQRRLEDGQWPRHAGEDGRSRVPLAALELPWLAAWGPDEVAALLRADQGESHAQAEVGAQLALAALAPPPGAALPCAEAARLAQHFLARAAQQDEADAMHWLALLSAAGMGEAANPAHTLQWLARAAAHGHAIAGQQVQGLCALA